MTIQTPIGFLGAGNMAEALVRGLLQAGVAAGDVLLSDPKAERLEALRQALDVAGTSDNAELARRCPVVVLAIKPQGAAEALPPLAGALRDRLVISLLAGVSTAQLDQWLAGGGRLVRTMPNTPALVGEGATALCAGPRATAEDLTTAEALFAASGLTVQVQESQMDAVTGLSGSGPAYVFALIEALADGGVAEGLPRDVALTLARQTVLGAARLARDTGEHPGVLKDRVCSPGGTTIAGMRALEDGRFRATLMQAVAAASRRSRELGGRS